MYKHKNITITIILFIIIVTSSYLVYAAIVNTEAVYNRSPNSIETIKAKAILRPLSVLTTSYVSTDSVTLQGFSNVMLMFDIGKGGLTSFQYRVLQSIDGFNWFYEGAESITSVYIEDYIPYYTRTLSGTNEKYFKIISFYGNYLKLEVKGIGTTSGSWCGIYVMSSQY